MLPFYERVISVDRSRYLPTHNRRIPVPRNPTTVGGHLRRRRLELRLHQSQAARRVGVSTRTLSLWECDKVFPKWKHQPRLAGFLGYDPFEDPLLERPLSNETPGVAFLAAGQPLAFGDEVRNLRLRLRLSRGECARKLDVDPKTLWGWETGKHQPPADTRSRTLQVLLAAAA